MSTSIGSGVCVRRRWRCDGQPATGRSAYDMCLTKPPLPPTRRLTRAIEYRSGTGGQTGEKSEGWGDAGEGEEGGVKLRGGKQGLLVCFLSILTRVVNHKTYRLQRDDDRHHYWDEVMDKNSIYIIILCTVTPVL